MADQPSSRRRFQFRLRTLMIVVTLLAVPLSYVGWQAKIVRERKGMIERIARNGGNVYPLFNAEPDETPPLVRRLMGDEAVGAIRIRGALSPDERRLLKAAFPEADVDTWEMRRGELSEDDK